MIATKQVDYAFTEETYCEYLEEIAGACGNETIYLFQDNAGYHKTDMCLDKMKELNIKPIWNVPYSPDFNSAVEVSIVFSLSDFAVNLLEILGGTQREI